MALLKGGLLQLPDHRPEENVDHLDGALDQLEPI
jgi:hypothetical protein